MHFYDYIKYRTNNNTHNVDGQHFILPVVSSVVGGWVWGFSAVAFRHTKQVIFLNLSRTDLKTIRRTIGVVNRDKPRSICSRKLSAVTKVLFSSPTGVKIAKIEGRDAPAILNEFPIRRKTANLVIRLRDCFLSSEIVVALRYRTVSIGNTMLRMKQHTP